MIRRAAVVVVVGLCACDNRPLAIGSRSYVGSADAGFAHDAGSVDAGADAGCADVLCPEIDWGSTQTSQWFLIPGGVWAQSMRDFRVMSSFSLAGSSSHFAQFEFTFRDGGVTQRDRQLLISANSKSHQVRGVAATDLWYAHGVAVAHVESGLTTTFYDCSLPDGGATQQPYAFSGVAPVSPNEAWFVGNRSICHWTRAGGMALAIETPGSKVYFEDVYRTPAGEVYAVGGESDSSYNLGPSVIVREDGTEVSAPHVVDVNGVFGFSSIDGVGTEVYVVSHSNASHHGEIFKRFPDGGFESVFTAPFRLYQLDVLPTGEVWAVGESADQALYFDGGAWGSVTLPTSAGRNIAWLEVQGTDDGLILSGYEQLTQMDARLVVNTYRRFGK